MRTMTVVSQRAAINYFTKARVAYDSKTKKQQCDRQIAVCRNILSSFGSKSGSSAHNTGSSRNQSTATAPNHAKSTKPMRNAVDLGTSVLWADSNVGATSPYEVGALYGWGDANGTLVSTNNDDYPHGAVLSVISGNPQYDVVTAQWGDGWRLPTMEEFLILYRTCT